MDRSVALFDDQRAIELPPDFHPAYLMKLEGIRFICFQAAC
jgi:hypothetical protein